MDSAAKIVRCFSGAVSDLGIAAPADARIRHIIGLGLREALQELLPDADDGTRARVAARYREYFLHIDRTETALFPDVREGLAGLVDAGFKLAVATGKARRGLERVFEQTGIAHLFCASRCADEAHSKPHPQMLYDILALTGTAAHEAVVVGDTTYDLQMATAATVASVAVTYGAHARPQLIAAGPKACLDSFSEVCQWLQ